MCGPGTIGLLTAAFARAMGAEVHVWALGRDREELAASFGATGYWTADDPPPETYDAVIDCTDDHQMPAAALARAEPAGRLVYIGIAGVPSPIDSRNLVLGDLTAVGILGASAGLAPAIEHYADGRVDPSRIVAGDRRPGTRRRGAGREDQPRRGHQDPHRSVRLGAPVK